MLHNETYRFVSSPHFQQHTASELRNTMKCAGIRMVKKKTVICCSPAKFQFDGFCSKDHRDEAKLYATSYEAHIETVKEVLDDPALVAAYNDKIRPYFTSSIIAGRENKEAMFLRAAEAKYAENAKVAWEVRRATSENDDSATVQNYKDTIEHRKCIKRKQKEAVDVSQLLVLSDSPPLEEVLYVGHADVPVAKKLKVQNVGEGKGVGVNAEPIVAAGEGGEGVGERADGDALNEGGEVLDEGVGGEYDGDYDAEADAALQKEIEDEIEANKVKLAAGVPLPDDDMDFDE